MTAQQKALEAPVLKEAIEGVLYVHNLIDPAHGVVWPYSQAAAGDKVEFTVRTSTDNTWQGQHMLTAGDAGKPIEFKIPKHVFEKNLKPGASANLHYVVIRSNQMPESSVVLTVQLER